MADRTPVEDLEGQELDAAIHEEVFGKRAHVVTEGDFEAKQSMSGAVDDDPIRSAFRQEAMRYSTDQRMISEAVPNYSSDTSDAMKLVNQFSRKGGDQSRVFVNEITPRALIEGEEAIKENGDAEMIARAALRAVREEE